MNVPYFIFYQVAMPLSMLATMSMVVLAWRHRRAPGALAMVALGVASFVWALGFYIESNLDTLGGQLLFNNIGYFGSMSVPVAWLLFAVRYTRGGKPIALWQILLICVLPVTSLSLVWTNNWHHLMWSNEHLAESGLFTVTAKTYGPFFWITIAYNYILVTVGAIILIRRLLVGPPLYHEQAISLLVAVGLPLAWNIIYVFNLLPLPRKELTPVMFSVSVVAISLGVMRFHLFKAVPFAYRMVIQQMSDGIFVFDSLDRLVEANPAALKMAGVDRSVVGKELRVLAPLSQMLQSVSAVRSGRIETRSTVSGGERFYELETMPMVEGRDQQVGWLAMVRDITERKRAEEARLELERKAQDVSRLASIGEMAAGVAHEINNPLTPVLGFADLLMQRDLPEDVKSDLKIIHDSARRTAGVTKRLLAFARQDEPVHAACNVNDVVTSALDLMAYQLETSGIKVVTELAPEPPVIIADADQLQQVFLNLIMNAEYEMARAHQGGRLLVKTEHVDDVVRASIQDDGPGISQENMKMLFTPFFTTKKVGEGTGLGLSICRSIVAGHNGRIYATSEEGKGAMFVVELPVGPPRKADVTKAPVSDTSKAVAGGKAHILVVDDEPAVVETLRQVLTAEGYEVRSADSAQEALRLIGSERFACILLDIKLPDMSGIEVYHHLVRSGSVLARRLVFVTGDVMGTKTVDFLARTGASCVTKPFDIEQLRREVRNKLNAPG